MDAYRAEEYHWGGDVVLSDLNLSGKSGDVILILGWRPVPGLWKTSVRVPSPGWPWPWSTV